ncbi:MAG: metalloregulator ArsR/SmtB family transcription factor [bacterium]
MTTPLAVIAEPRRQAILRLVWNEERGAGDIAAHFDITFGAVSQHLRVLREAGLVTMRKDGRQHFYRADIAAFGALAPVLEAMWRDRLSLLKTLAEAEEPRNARKRR